MGKNQYLDIPDLGSQVGLISRQQEKQIGEKVLRQVRQQLPEIQDAWLEDEINQIFASIYSQTNMGKPIALVVVRDQQINAFAVPGGLFAINAGTITSSHNIDEIAGVMAHEIAHVTQRHYSRSQEAFKGQGLLALAGLLAGIAVASQSSDAGAAVMLGTQAAMLDKQLSYSRNQEREADRVGMQYMAIAGYNPESMADFFELMQRSSTQLSYLPDFWLTHPLTTERMSEARLRARQYNIKTNNSLEKQQKFELIRWRTAVLGGYANLNQLKSLALRNSSAALALASYYIQHSQYQNAKDILDTIQPTAIQKTLYSLTWSDWYMAQGQYEQALQTILPLYRIAPENRAVALKLAEIYILNKQPNDANKILTTLSSRFPMDTSVWQLLQRAEDLRVDSPVRAINVLRYRAEVQFWNGQEEEAIKSLLHAQRLSKEKNNEALKAQIEGRLKQMQDARQLKI
ncbi:M48 family metalloprotease [Acinetobacter puyangensis]|uniref:Putative beta-barrel assembly-enhancing protease n=3 Tax=Acinetobacter puyangensis TaxID=1096779 RepID=A0A240ECC2_9GAMM|nr:Putative Zn-dependent protease, contains TPR repeats [Acinetobacter puyangensis]